MIFRRMIALVCAAALVISMVSGCSGKDKNPSTAADTTNTVHETSGGENLGDGKASSEKITVSAFASPFPEVKLLDYDYEKNHFTKWLEDTTNVHLKWVLAPSSAEVSQKLSMLLNSGDVPDIMFQNGFTPSMQELYGNQGLLLQLNEYIDKYGYWMKKMFEEVPDAKDAVTLNGGKIFCMPSYAEDTHMKSFYKMWIYKPWLDQLKLPVPKTTEEFYQTLKAFKERDPNGNGKPDEIPLLGMTAWVAWNPTTYLMNAFIYYDPEKRMIMENGKVKPVFNTNEFKEGVKYISKLSKEELLSPETFTMDLNQFKATVENADVPLVGVIPSHAPFVVASTRYKDYIPMEPLEGPGGVKNANYHFITNNMGVVISAQCKYPVEVFKMLDFIYSPEATLRCINGRPGFEWDYCKEGEGNGSEGKPAKYKKLGSGNNYDENAGEKNVSWYMIANTYQPVSMYEGWLERPEDKDNPAKVLKDSTVNMYLPYQPDVSKVLPQTIVFTEEESTEITDIDITIGDYVAESLALFILGEKDVDKDWDSYVKEINNMGLDKLLSMYQTAIDRRVK